MLREKHHPRDIGFDPLGLKPKDSQEFAKLQTNKLSNGQLAMLASVGMCVQELANGKGVFWRTSDFESHGTGTQA
ncbi:hypothetical protein ACHAWF_018574 [Thalassiosira exigua]